VARGVHEKKLQWTDTIASHLPGFTLQDPYVGSHVTVQDMLAHRSGLPHAAGDLLEDLGYSRDVILDRLRLEPLTPFRTIHNYSNFGYTSGSEAAARAAGMSWEDFADVMLFHPLGMSTASYRHADFVSRPNRSAMHVRVDGVWQQKYARNADPEAPAGGASASIVDLAKWLMLQLAEGAWNGAAFIDPEVLRVMRSPAILAAPPRPAISRSSFYGQGLDISDDGAGRVRWSHSGGFFQGAATQVLMLPSVGLGIVTLTNGMPVGLPESIGASFLDLVEASTIQRDWLAGYGGLFAASMTNPSKLAGKTPPANPTPAKPNAFYVGTYDNAYYGSIQVVDHVGTLHLLIGPHPDDFPLTHWDGNEFSFFPTGENALGITAADFTPNAAGTHAASVVLEYYNDNGLGTFTLH
jgi:CubicO group peptidase (beta-lactamase class C family)